MTDNLRVEALRLATALSGITEDPADVVARATHYHAFLTDTAMNLSMNISVNGADAAVDEIEKVAEAAAKAAPRPKAKPAPAPEPEPAAEDTVTIERVRAALKEYRAIEGAPAMMTVLKEIGGAEALTAVDPSKYAAIMEAIGA